MTLIILAMLRVIQGQADEGLLALDEAPWRETALVGHAREASPWHRDRLAGVDLARLDERTLAELPAMTKADLMAHFDQVVTDPRLRLDVVEAHLAGLSGDAYLFDRYHVIASGGSSGRRGVFVYDWEAWARRWLGYLRWELRDWRLDPDLRHVPMVFAGLGAAHAAHGSRALAATFSGSGADFRSLSVTQPTVEIVAGLNELQPTILGGYPSALRALTDEVLAGWLRIRPRRVVTAAEPLLPEVRTALEEAWGAPVRYGCSEAGALAIACGRGPGLHLSDDLVVVEPVDEAGRPVPPGERATKVYLTNLYNPVLPLIRYELTDEVTVLPESCPCGSAMRLVADPQGRLDDTFAYGPLRVHPHVFRSALGRRPEVVEYQVRQTPRGAAIALCCRAPLDTVALGSEVADALRRLGLASPDVSVAVVESLPRQAAGKLKRFVPLLAPQPSPVL